MLSFATRDESYENVIEAFVFEVDTNNTGSTRETRTILTTALTTAL